MKIIEIINKVDNLNNNQYSQEDKIKWLSNVEGMIKAEIIDTHEDSEKVIFDGYDENTDTATVLLVPEPYSEIYKHYLDAQIYLCNGEITKYNNSIALYNNTYTAYRDYYNRLHMPVQKARITV